MLEALIAQLQGELQEAEAVLWKGGAGMTFRTEQNRIVPLDHAAQAMDLEKALAAKRHQLGVWDASYAMQPGVAMLCTLLRQDIDRLESALARLEAEAKA